MTAILVAIPVCAWFVVAAFAARFSYRWWMEQHGVRGLAWTMAAVTFVVPPSVIFEVMRK